MKFLLTLFPAFFINVKLFFFPLKTANDKCKSWLENGHVMVRFPVVVVHNTLFVTTRKGELYGN